MSAAIENPAKCEVRSVIRFLYAKNHSAAEIHRELCAVYGPNIMSEDVVRQWVRFFKDGRTNVHDEERSGRPSLVSDDLLNKVNEKLCENRRFTITELSGHFPQVSRSLIHEIVTEKLGYKKFCARWVPKLLTDDHKTKRMSSAIDFLSRYELEGAEFLNRIVTGDEINVAYVNAETKQQSMQWGHTASPSKPKKARQTLSAKKVMAMVFWDSKGILLIEFMERGTTITSEVYCETLKWLRRAIQNKRRGLLTCGVVFLHDNARPHTARRRSALLEKFDWDIFDQPRLGSK
uniref:Mos1 transposase HTH domain-containing protein n=1 Tax=Clastoptera arizonana TaxID=38151 RepID=A0A1B6DDI6_9HEMI